MQAVDFIRLAFILAMKELNLSDNETLLYLCTSPGKLNQMTEEYLHVAR